MMAALSRTFACVSFAVAAIGFPATPHSSGAEATVMVANPIDLQRPSETIELDLTAITRVLPFEDPQTIHARDDRTGQDLLTQAVDLDDNGTFEQLLFQTDLGPKETKRFTLTVGERRVPRPSEFMAYGRFVRERRDDFAWENDRIAHRMYGAALETWAQEPLTSSAVDVWTKRTHRLVINDWYMVDDYHRDTGEGADLYSAGRTRGCGGNALWRDGRLYPSANFRNSRVLANGPIRVLFELTYGTWDAGGTAVGETKRISLDAGQRLDRFESTFTGVSGALQHAVGIRKAQGADVSINRPAGLLRTWEAFKEPNGHLGCGVIVDPAAVKDSADADGNVLLLTYLPGDARVSYYAGFTWDRSDGPSSTAEWDRYLADFARRVRERVEVAVK